jgi:AAHS family 4-hydroxybenzoate transporter-like MFS transporter
MLWGEAERSLSGAGWRERMNEADNIDVQEVIDRQGFGGAFPLMFALLFLSLLSDGFDLQTVGFAAPSLVREWGVSRPELAPALSAGLVGVLIGAPLFGWFGDRYGRKRAIVVGSLIYGAFSLACVWAGSVVELALLRFLTGIGLGGVLPNVIAMAAELSPRRIRAIMTPLVTVGISLGAVTVGIVAASLVPAQGWRMLFVIGGVVPLLLALVVQLWLPESPSYLALRPERRADLMRFLKRIRPDLAIGPQTTIRTLAHDQREAAEGNLFEGEFRMITPLIWILFAGLLLTIYLLTSWLPLVLEDGGMSPQGAAIMNTLLQFGGAVGGLIASFLLGRLGTKLIPLLLGLAFLLVAILALVDLDDTAMAAILGLCGICIIGGQTAANASAGLIYPTRMRAKGIGSALGVGRLGSIAGPLIGGFMIGAGAAGTQDLFLLPLIPLGLGMIAGIFLARRRDIRGAEAAH